MAKKALSISLVAAMLATSNVPVWAAEFSDGTEPAPVVVEESADVEAFSAEDVAPATEVLAQSVTTGKEYSVTATPLSVNGAAITNNEVIWGNTVETTVTVTKAETTPAGATIKAMWKENGNGFGTIATLVNGTGALSCTPTDVQTGSKLTLFVYAEASDGTVVWSYTSDEITVKAKDISTVITNNQISLKSSFSPVYNGKAQVPTVDDIDFTNANGWTKDDFVIGSTDGDTVNVTDKGVDVYLSTTKKGYTGSVVLNYKIAPLTLTNATVNDWLTASYVKTSTPYTGNTINLKKADVKLVDKKTGVDLTSYVTGDADTTVITIAQADATAGKTFNTGKGGDFSLTFPISTPTESTYKNYTISNNVVIAPSNSFTITKRNLSSVTVTIPEQTYTGNIVTVNAGSATYIDKDTKEVLNLGRDVQIVSTASAQGEHDVTVVPATNNQNVEGSTTAKMRIAATSLASAAFSNTAYATSSEEYTGERVLKDTTKLGSVRANGKTLVAGEDYVIEFGTNIDAGTNAGSIIIKGLKSYAGSIKTINFTINPAEVNADTVTYSKFVEKKDTKKASDYKDSFGLVVKAKNKDGKEFTLTEGIDYVAEYSFANNATGEVGDKVRVTLKATTAGLLKNTNFKATVTSFDSEITKTIIKDENIKLKQTSYEYTGAAIQPKFDVVVDGRVIEPTKYTVKSITNNVNAGTATMVITGDGTNYSKDVDAKVTFTVTPADASKLTGVIASRVYTGYSIQPAFADISLSLNNVPINVKDNFTLTYGENINIGEGTVVLTPKNGNFTGTKTVTFKIAGKMLSGGALKYYDKNGLPTTLGHTYDGTAYAPAKTVFDSSNTQCNNGTTTGTLTDTITEGTDYEIKYVDNVYGKKDNSTQKGIVLVIAKGSYAGDYTGNGVTNGIYTDAAGNKVENVVYAETFVITQEIVSTSNVSVSNATYAGGLPVKPVVTVNVKGKTLVEGTDYDLDLTDPANKDLANVTATKSLVVKIVPKNGYVGDRTLLNKKFNWGIDKFDLTNAKVTVDGDTVTVKCGSVDIPTSEYTVTKDAEKDTITVAANKDSKNYTGSKTINAVVTTPGEKPDTPMIASVQVTGNNAKVILSGEVDGATGYDYVISTDRNCITNKDYDKVNKNILTTNTTFTYTQQGTYYAYCHAWKRDENGKKVFGDWSNAYPFVVSAITPEQPGITSVKVSGSTVTVTYTKSANATGYDVVLGSAVKKVNGESRPVEYGTLVKKVTKGSTVTATFKNVKKGTYYAGLHAYNRTSEDGKKVFSPWSNTKKVTVK